MGGQTLGKILGGQSASRPNGTNFSEMGRFTHFFVTWVERAQKLNPQSICYFFSNINMKKVVTKKRPKNPLKRHARTMNTVPGEHDFQKKVSS